MTRHPDPQGVLAQVAAAVRHALAMHALEPHDVAPFAEALSDAAVALEQSEGSDLRHAALLDALATALESVLEPKEPR